MRNNEVGQEDLDKVREDEQASAQESNPSTGGKILYRQLYQKHLTKKSNRYETMEN